MMVGSLDKAHIDEMYKLSVIDSAIDFTYSALSSEINEAESHIALVLSSLSAIDVSEIESRVEHIQSDVDALKEDVSLLQSFTESKLDHLALMISELSAVDISEIESRVTHMQSDVEAIKSEVRHTKSDVEAVKSEVRHIKGNVDYLMSDVSAVESKLDGQISSHLIHIQSDVDTAKSDIQGLLIDVSDIESKIDGPVTSYLVHEHSDIDTLKSDIQALLADVSLVESKIEGPIYSHLGSIKVDVSDVESKVEAAESDIHRTYNIVVSFIGHSVASSEAIRDVESKLDGWVYSNLVNVKDDTEHLPSWVQGVKDDISAAGGSDSTALSLIESKLDGWVYSNLVNIHDDTLLIPDVQSDVHAAGSRIADIKSDVETIKSEVRHTKSDVETLLGYSSSIESKLDGLVYSELVAIHAYAGPTNSRVTDIQSHVHTINSRIEHVKSDLEDVKSHVDDMVSHIHEIHTDTIALTTYIADSVASSEALRVVDSNIEAIFDLQEAGGTLKLTGAEQDLFVNAAPAGNYRLDRLLIDLTNMAPSAATTYDSVIVREYVRIKSGGAYRLAYSELFVGSQILPLQIWPRDSDGVFDIPNRYGMHIAILQTGNAIAGSFITVDYEYFTYS